MERTELIQHWENFQKSATLSESALCASYGDDFVKKYTPASINFQRFCNYAALLRPSVTTATLLDFRDYLFNVDE